MFGGLQSEGIISLEILIFKAESISAGDLQGGNPAR